MQNSLFHVTCLLPYLQVSVNKRNSCLCLAYVDYHLIEHTVVWYEQSLSQGTLLPANPCFEIQFFATE